MFRSSRSAGPTQTKEKTSHANVQCDFQNDSVKKNILSDIHHILVNTVYYFLNHFSR